MISQRKIEANRRNAAKSTGRDGQPMSWSPQERSTLVDIRWKSAPKVSLCLTFRPARRDPDVSELDPQVVLYQGYAI
jgi:hypothetical protein